MTKENKLNYCKGCTKRVLNMQVGLVCSLTNEKGDFNNSCPNYESIESINLHRQKFKNKRILQKMSTFLF